MTNTTTKLAVAVALIGSLACATPSFARSVKSVQASPRVLINTPKFDQRSSYADDYSFWHRYDDGMHD